MTGPARVSAPVAGAAEASRDQLGPAEEQLIKVAALARERAYAPYSKYRVGAAIRTKRNKIHSGANIENASYGLTVCAERCAAFAAVAAGDTKDWDAIAIVTDEDVLPSPCGACRQVLHEFSPDLKVILATTTGLRKVTTLRELLPEPFGPERLGR
jgi:cytidine deaminase